MKVFCITLLMMFVGAAVVIGKLVCYNSQGQVTQKSARDCLDFLTFKDLNEFYISQIVWIIIFSVFVQFFRAS